MAVVVVEALWLSTCLGCGEARWNDDHDFGDTHACYLGYQSERYHRITVDSKSTRPLCGRPVP